MVEAAKKNSEINENQDWDKTKKRKPLYELKNQIRQANFQLEMLKKDPANNHDEITELETKISKWKHEYAERVRQLKMKIT